MTLQFSDFYGQFGNSNSNTVTWTIQWSENVRSVWRLLGVHLDRKGYPCVPPLAINGHAYRRRVLSRRGRR